MHPQSVYVNVYFFMPNKKYFRLLLVAPLVAAALLASLTFIEKKIVNVNRTRSTTFKMAIGIR